jgi:hypothetical protein
MKHLFRPAIATFAVCLAFVHPAFIKSVHLTKTPVFIANSNPKIQVAVLLDVSNSMDGLIAQAKAQLWNMVSVMSKAKCDEASPQIEIALYEYGSPRDNIKEGYVKQINGFTNDLDLLSNNLFGLTTNGGDEYCGHVIYTSIEDLGWDSSAANYKVIFIAGNEDFLQGDISFTKACAEAKKKGVIVNTIYCGNRLQGIQEHWNLGAECGDGSFTNIDQDAKLEEIPTPYDSTLMVLNEQLNSTYLYYGIKGKEKLERQRLADANNASISMPVAAKRVTVKGNKASYFNSSWDLLDASTADSNFIAKVDMKSLPDSLQNKSRAELQKIVRDKANQRNLTQQRIGITSAEREKYIAAERLKSTTNNNTPTLETEIEKIIKEQAKRFNMIIH